MANQHRSSLRCSRLLRTLLVGAVVPYAAYTFNAVLFTGGCAPHTVQRRTRTLARNADPPQAPPELPPFQRFPDDYNPDPLDRAVEWFMALDPESNSRLETVFTLIVLAITVISAKETYEKWLREKTEEDNLRKQKIRRALNPDGWREELFKEEQAEKLKKQQKEQKRGVKDVLEEIYGTDGLEDQFDSRIRPGTRRPPTKSPSPATAGRAKSTKKG
eukprot:s945_g3.t1